jgi:hypothetical protein
MKHHYSWIIILLGVVVLTGCVKRQNYKAISAGSGVKQDIHDVNELRVYKSGDTVWVNYYGSIIDHKQFDTIGVHKFIIQ